MTYICDYCQGPGAFIVNDEGFTFHRECAERFIYEQEPTRGRGCQPLTVFKNISKRGIMMDMELYECFSDESELLTEIEKLKKYISTLESRLRWRKVEEDKPEIGKLILIRNVDDDLLTIGMLCQYTDTKNYYWNTDIEYRNFDFCRFTEWREI